MTCICGVVQNGRVYIGADSAGSNSWEIRIRKDSKVFKKDNMIFGFCGSFRMGQILKYNMTLPNRPENIEDDYYLAQYFIPEIRKVFFEHGFMKKEHSVEEGGFFLIGYNGVLYEIESDFQIGIVQDSYTAIGSGSEYALGALSAIAITNLPEDKIEIALKAAEKFDPFVRGPFNIISI